VIPLLMPWSECRLSAEMLLPDTRLSIFDLTDPARIKLVASHPSEANGTFDFVRSLAAMLVSFRDSQQDALLKNADKTLQIQRRD